MRNDLCATIGRVQYAAPGYIAEQLFASTLVPVCTPELAAGLRKPSVIGWHGPARQPKPGGVREPLCYRTQLRTRPIAEAVMRLDGYQGPARP
jgi:hypothetical protein